MSGLRNIGTMWLKVRGSQADMKRTQKKVADGNMKSLKINKEGTSVHGK